MAAILLATALLPSVLLQNPQGDESVPTTLVTAKRIVVAPDTVLEDSALLLRNGKVVLVGPEIPAEAKRGVPVVSFDGTLMPGMVLAHTYLGEADDLAERTDAVTPQLRAADALDPFDDTLAQLARHGITTATVAPVSANTLAGLAAVVKTGEVATVLTPESYLKAALVDESLDQERYPTSRMGAADLLREKFRAAREGPADTPELAALRAVLDGRHRLAIHARERAAIVEALNLFEQLGLPPLLIGAEEIEDVLPRMAKLGGSVILEPLHAGDPLPRLELPAKLEAHNVPFSFSIDGAPQAGDHQDNGMREVAPGVFVFVGSAPTAPATAGKPGHPDLLRLSAALAMRHGLSRRAALEALTRTPAKQSGVDDHVGTLRQGRDADFVVFGGDPLDLSSPVLAVYVGGRRIEDDRGSDLR